MARTDSLLQRPRMACLAPFTLLSLNYSVTYGNLPLRFIIAFRRNVVDRVGFL